MAATTLFFVSMSLTILGTLYKAYALFGLSLCEMLTMDPKTLLGPPLPTWPLSPFQTQDNFLSVNCESVNYVGK